MTGRCPWVAMWSCWPVWHGGLSHSTLPAALHMPLDLSVSWAAEPVAQPLPPPPMPPPLRPQPRVNHAVRTSIPVAPVLEALPSTALAPDVVVATASVMKAAPPNAIVMDALPASKTAPATQAAPVAPKTDELPRWRSQLEAMLLKHKHYPMVGRRMRQEGVVTVMAHFSAQGDLLHCAIATSSGFKALDEAAMQLVRQAAEMARANRQPGQVAELHIPVVYELKES